MSVDVGENSNVVETSCECPMWNFECLRFAAVLLFWVSCSCSFLLYFKLTQHLNYPESECGKTVLNLEILRRGYGKKVSPHKNLFPYRAVLSQPFVRLYLMLEK
jgi:hypothetical protein